MQYSELNITHHQEPTQTEILIAQLGELEFDSFVENPNQLLAYVLTENLKEEDVRLLLKSLPNIDNFSIKKIEEQNWNAVWESSYEPVCFGNFCNIRAPFHDPVSDVKFDLIIEPKMSFGTAHHETTSLMIEWLKTEPVKGKRILDMGCGTGILAILVKKLGAEIVEAIDNDEWAFENTKENILRNETSEIIVELGDAENLNGKNFDLVIANINRNILIRDMPMYVQTMSKDAVILLSGFYKSDLEAVEKACIENGLNYVSYLEKNHWVAAKFIKS
ncbi:MAG: 50S ribosomal protein L11 methyltransferase [Bacteroidales bacterium]|jgi:ribosomal protein L11 methyltransferase|nr:50S ribosomal protein L11 methyltransferase [Bacteroidales bacterium]